MPLFTVYKPGQGKYTRLITLVSVTVVGAIGAYVLSERLRGASLGAYVIYGVPSALVAVIGAFMAWMVNRPSSADFLIQTEGEMKKVSWSSQREVIGSTKVVIVAAFMLAGILYAVDVLFQVVFSSIGIWMRD